MPVLLFVGGALLNVAGTFALRSPSLRQIVDFWQLPAANVVLLTLGGGAALLLDRQLFSRRSRVGGGEISYHLLSSWAALLILAAIWGVHYVGIPALPARADWLMWAALAAVALLFALRLAKPGASDPVAGIHLAGILGVAYGLAYLPAEWMTGSSALATWGIALGTYGLIAASTGSAIVRMLPDNHPCRRFAVDWLRFSSATLAAFAGYGAIWCDWNILQPRVRLLAAVVACAQAVGLAALADEDFAAQSLALVAGAIGAVAIAWAAMPTAYLGRWLDVTSAALGALAAYSLAAAVTGTIAGEKWRSAIRCALLFLAGAVSIGMVAVVVGEAGDYARGIPPMISRWAVIWIEAGLLAGLVGAIGLAAGVRQIVPGASTACVCAAEALGLLAFVHLRTTEPGLFSQQVEAYWPMIVMGLAFAMLGGGFAANRRGRGQIGRPLVYTGVALPLAVMAGYWLHPSAVVDYSAVLWTAGALYGIVAAVRRSMGVTLLAAGCMNAALCVVWSRHAQTEFFVHPQLWLLPAALSVLAAAQLHHRQLTTEKLRSLRYVCLGVIYLSSTADVVLNGVTAAPWLPIVLASLAVVGVLAGITWRIRPFLYLGMTFLMIAVLMMIWTAQANLHWTWLWYVAGLSAGIALFTVFGLFERRHEQITRLLASLREWQ